MPDISMCATEDCPLSDKCYRKQAKPDEYQSYSKFEWIITHTGPDCGYFWEIEKEE